MRSNIDSEGYIFVRRFRHYRTKQWVYPKHGQWIRIPKSTLKRRS